MANSTESGNQLLVDLQKQNARQKGTRIRKSVEKEWDGMALFDVMNYLQAIVTKHDGIPVLRVESIETDDYDLMGDTISLYVLTKEEYEEELVEAEERAELARLKAKYE